MDFKVTVKPEIVNISQVAPLMSEVPPTEMHEMQLTVASASSAYDGLNMPLMQHRTKIVLCLISRILHDSLAFRLSAGIQWGSHSERPIRHSWQWSRHFGVL